MKVIASKQAGIQPVYDIGVPNTHNFILENGLVSHNCFNKSHGIAYSMITYICAWLKANYPQEFFCSLMTTRSRSLQPKDWSAKAPILINEARQLGVHISSPTINASDIGFTIRDNNVYFGLNAIKNVGLTTAKSITRTRGKTPFKTIVDFISRVNLSKVNIKTFEALVKAGTFDRMGYQRKTLLDNTNPLYDWIKNLQDYYERTAINNAREKENQDIEPILEKRNELRKIKRLRKERELTPEEENFLEETLGLRLHKVLKVPDCPPEPPAIPQHPSISLSVVELMQQAEYIGCFIGIHPASIIYPDSTRIAEARLQEKQSLAGVVSHIKVIKDRNAREMAFMGYGDGTGIAEAVIFASTYEKLKASGNIPEPGDLIETYGVVEKIDPQVKVKLFSVQKHRSDI